MSWPLSHTAEGYAYAANRIAELPRRTLQDAAIGWKRGLKEAGELKWRGFNVRRVPHDALVDFVTEHALSDRGRCTNGGWELYVDPDGYILVPFSPEETD